MTTTAERLRKAREAAGFATAADFARHVGVKPVTYRTHETGHAGLKPDIAQLYSAALGVKVAWLLYGDDEGPRLSSDLQALEADLRKKVETEPAGPQRDVWLKVIAEIERTKAAGQAYGHMDVETAATVPSELHFVRVRGAVEAGAWKEAVEWPEEDWYPVPAVPMPAYTDMPQFALEVRGPSMNAVYPDGSMVVCVFLMHLSREPRSGERVVVERRRSGFVEATVKEYVVEDGVPKLYPRSDHPKHQEPIVLQTGLQDGEDENQDEQTRITAVVVGSFRPEPFLQHGNRARPSSSR